MTRRKQLQARKCRACPAPIGANNRSGVCDRCRKSRGKVCTICGGPCQGGRKCQACMERYEAFRQCWQSNGIYCPTSAPAEWVEERIRVYRERAARGLPLYEGGDADVCE